MNEDIKLLDFVEHMKCTCLKNSITNEVIAKCDKCKEKLEEQKAPSNFQNSGEEK